MSFEIERHIPALVLLVFSPTLWAASITTTLSGTDIETSAHSYAFVGNGFSMVGTAAWGAVAADAPPCNSSFEVSTPCLPGKTFFVEDFFSSGLTGEIQFGAGIAGTITVDGTSYRMIDIDRDLGIGAPVDGPSPPGSVLIFGGLDFTYELRLPLTSSNSGITTVTVPFTTLSVDRFCGYTATGDRVDGNPFCVSFPIMHGTATVNLSVFTNGTGAPQYLFDSARYTFGTPEPNTGSFLAGGFLVLIMLERIRRCRRGVRKPSA